VKKILKLIKSLLLDALLAKFEKIKSNKNRLLKFHVKLRGLIFFDPACSCGNFLFITYCELRMLEFAVLRSGSASSHQALDIQALINVDVDQFYGIEIEYPSANSTSCAVVNRPSNERESTRIVWCLLYQNSTQSHATYCLCQCLTVGFCGGFAGRNVLFYIG
jgi:hypothetical protein